MASKNTLLRAVVSSAKELRQSQAQELNRVAPKLGLNKAMQTIGSTPSVMKADLKLSAALKEARAAGIKSADKALLKYGLNTRNPSGQAVATGLRGKASVPLNTQSAASLRQSSGDLEFENAVMKARAEGWGPGSARAQAEATLGRVEKQPINVQRAASLRQSKGGGVGDQPRVPAGNPDGGQFTKG